MPHLPVLDVKETGFRIKGKARAGAVQIPPNSSKSPRPGKRDRRKRKVPSRSNIVDMTTGGEKNLESKARDAEESFISFSGGHSLASSEAGPSRQRSPAPPYTPTSFKPISRSILAGLSFRPSPVLSSRHASPSKVPDLSVKEVIDEKPASISPALSPPPDPAPASLSSSEHFEPPGLFTASLMPGVCEVIAQVEAREPEVSKLGGDAAQEGDSLLLPSHVLLDMAPPAKSVWNEEGESRQDESSMMEGLHFLDDDVSKGVTRYFATSSPPQTAEATFLASADQSKICQNCKRPGHRMRDCPHTICMACGAEDQHERRDCPMTLVCFRCAQRGHRQADCPNPVSQSRRQGCDRCGNRDHMENSCPSLWRVYSYHSPEERRTLQNQKSTAEGWAKEAVGAGPMEEWCYNCAEEGHLGDDCQQRRGSFARLYVLSAFSVAMSTRGPFANTGSARSNAPPTHARWTNESELPYMSRGFEGGMAGKKTRDKDKRRMIDRERAVVHEDEDDWFGEQRRSNGYPAPRKGSPYQKRQSDANRRPGRSDDRFGKRDHMPFSHSHLMSPAPATPVKGISFGKLALPVNSSPSGKGRKLGTSGSTTGDRGKGRSTPAGKAHLPRRPEPPGAGPASGSTGSKKRRKTNEEKGRDWENEWRASGKGGGPVFEWGKDMDREERKMKVEATKISGQRYTGGY